LGFTSSFVPISKKEPRQEKACFPCHGRELPLGPALGEEREACAREKARTRRWDLAWLPHVARWAGRTKAEPNSARLPLHIASHHPLFQMRLRFVKTLDWIALSIYLESSEFVIMFR
jgi:hypothetical protein